MLHRLLGILYSFFQIAFRIIFARKAQVLFYYPQHFNRSAAGTNPFFDPLLQTCEEAGISYKLLEEPDWGTDKPRNPSAIKADAFFVLVLILRKLVKLAGIKDFYAAEPHVARLVNVLTFGRLRYRRYVTISGSMQHLFLYLDRLSIVYDFQHGIWTKYNVNFFNEKYYLHSYLENEHLHWLMWGEGFKDSFVRCNANLSKRIHIIGFYSSQSINHDSFLKAKNNIILISLQIVDEWDDEKISKYISLLDSILSEINPNKYRVLIKHHPRCSHKSTILGLFAKYDFLQETTMPLEELVKIVGLQISAYSTTIFDYAKYSIPSFIMYSEDFYIGKHIFYDDFSYPLYRGKSLSWVLDSIEDPINYNNDSIRVNSWFHYFYSNYSKDAFIGLLR